MVRDGKLEIGDQPSVLSSPLVCILSLCPTANTHSTCSPVSEDSKENLRGQDFVLGGQD